MSLTALQLSLYNLTIVYPTVSQFILYNINFVCLFYCSSDYIISIIQIIIVYLPFLYILINSQKKDDPCKTWVKISKVMPHSHSPFSPGKGGKPYGKTSKYPHLLAKNIVWLTVHIASKFNRTHSFLNLQQNFQTKFSSPVLYFGKIPANYANSAQFAHMVHESHEIRTICNLLYSMFQTPDQWQRTP